MRIPLSASTGTGASPARRATSWPTSATVALYSGDAPNQVLTRATSVQSAGGSQPHENMQPFVAINFIISLFGIFPSQTKGLGHVQIHFLAEIRIFRSTSPRSAGRCVTDSSVPISQNTALFSLLGTTYGGDGKSNFALPNLQGCAPVQPGQGPGLSLRDQGETGGEQTVTLLGSEMPAHDHRYKRLRAEAPTSTLLGRPSLCRVVRATSSTTARRRALRPR